MKKIKVFIILPLLLCTITGCWDQKVYEEIGFILSAGIEESPNGLSLTYISPLIEPENLSKLSEIATGEDVTLAREGTEKARLTTSRNIEGGIVQQFIFSSKIAQTGIDDLLTIFERESINPVQPHLIIMDGSPRDLFKTVLDFKNKPRPSIYLRELLRDAIASSYIPDTRVYNYHINYFSGGTDSIVPMIKLEPEHIKVTGSALLHIDKMVGKIDVRQTSMLLALMGKMKRTQYISKTIDESSTDKSKLLGIAVTLKKAKRKINISMENSSPKVNLSLEFKAVCDEGKWGLDFADQKTKNKIEKDIENNIKDDCMMVLNYCQQTGSDPIGIGDLLRANYPDYWKKTTWLDAYQAAIFNLSIVIHIENHGLIN